MFGSLIDNTELHDPDQVEPILEVIYARSNEGLDAIESSDQQLLLLTANRLTEAYSAIP
jgi:hypothetical protein